MKGCKGEIKLRDGIRQEFLDIYAKMICLEGIIDDFDHIVKAQS